MLAFDTSTGLKPWRCAKDFFDVLRYHDGSPRPGAEDTRVVRLRSAIGTCAQEPGYVPDAWVSGIPYVQERDLTQMMPAGWRDRETYDLVAIQLSERIPKIAPSADDDWVYKALALREITGGVFREGRAAAAVGASVGVQPPSDFGPFLIGPDGANGDPATMADLENPVPPAFRDSDEPITPAMRADTLSPVRLVTRHFNIDPEVGTGTLPDIDRLKDARDEAHLMLAGIDGYAISSKAILGETVLDHYGRPDWTGEPPYKLRTMAEDYADQFDPDERGYCDPNEATWSYHSRFSIERVAPDLDAIWLETERQAIWEDLGIPRYEDLITQAVVEPVVMLQRDDENYLWDGCHRVAAQRFKGQQQVRAIVGEPNPEPTATPGW